jgi:putative ATP-dependent endonuclease of OLD family
VKTLIEQKGDGVQSLAALALASNYRSGTAEPGSAGNAQSRVIAIEEPEAHLHPGAIRYLRTMLEEMSKDKQVIISTHSPIFVNVDRVDANIIVSRGKAQAARSLSKIRDTLGIKAPDNLTNAGVMILVEGECDRVYLREYIRQHRTDLDARFADRSIVIENCAGSDRVTYLAQQYQSMGIKVVVLLDGDNAGDQTKDKLIENNILPSRDIYQVTKDGQRVSEIEDLLPRSIVEEVIRREGISVDDSFFDKPSRFEDRTKKLFQESGKPMTPKAYKELKINLSQALDQEKATTILQSFLCIDNLLTNVAPLPEHPPTS